MRNKPEGPNPEIRSGFIGPLGPSLGPGPVILADVQSSPGLYAGGRRKKGTPLALSPALPTTFKHVHYHI